MKNKINFLSLFFVLLTLILISSDYSSYHYTAKLFVECNETTGCFEHSQSNCLEEDALFNAVSIKIIPCDVDSEHHISLNTNLQDNYSAFVWQPPKFS